MDFDINYQLTSILDMLFKDDIQLSRIINHLDFDFTKKNVPMQPHQSRI